MTNLIRQSSSFPTRKILAVILSGIILGVCQSLLRYFWPDHPFSPYMEDVDIWLQGLIMVIAGYITKEKEKNVEDAKPLQGNSSKGSCNSDSQLSFDPLWSDEEKTGQAGSGDTSSPTRREETGESS